jgi:hypothetical protein
MKNLTVSMVLTEWLRYLRCVKQNYNLLMLAQKDENGKIFWVKFTPQYHTHLVKYAAALVPCTILKVKKVMFAYILETLNREALKVFFDLTKGPHLRLKA